MNYTLAEHTDSRAGSASAISALGTLWPLLAGERRQLLLSFVSIVINSGLNLLAPLLIGHTIDSYIQTRRYQGVLLFCGILLGMYVVAFVANYFQTALMGGVGQRLLFTLRSAVFDKLQELPVAFFNQNKAGDLISRINNDTDKLNQFFSQAVMQFVGNVFVIAGAGIFLLSINFRLGGAALIPAVGLVVVTRSLSGWIRRRNAESLRTLGEMSAEIQESLHNFKVVVAFNRRDYLRNRFGMANENNFSSAVKAGMANNVLYPIFGFSSNLAQLIVLTYGIYLISVGNFTIGLLISFIAYVTRFYGPLQQMAFIWSSFQTAMAGWARIGAILSLKSDLVVEPIGSTNPRRGLLAFDNVHFHYLRGQEILHGINFTLERGMTYAMVGPTGGGKTTTASLMARLYDPTEGLVLLDGKDIRSYPAGERTQRIGFILQDPFLFTGTVKDNILYGNDRFKNLSDAGLIDVLRRSNLETLLARFERGLTTNVTSSGDAISLGQKQLIAFMRAVLRDPDILILDEATANIDTVTEKLLDEILQKLPEHTTRVVIAHRLNTIENADQIFFVNAGDVIRAGSLDQAVDMLMQETRGS